MIHAKFSLLFHPLYHLELAKCLIPLVLLRMLRKTVQGLMVLEVWSHGCCGNPSMSGVLLWLG